MIPQISTNRDAPIIIHVPVPRFEMPEPGMLGIPPEPLWLPEEPESPLPGIFGGPPKPPLPSEGGVIPPKLLFPSEEPDPPELLSPPGGVKFPSPPGGVKLPELLSPPGGVKPPEPPSPPDDPEPPELPLLLDEDLPPKRTGSSGYFVRIDRETHEYLDRIAEARGMSIVGVVRQLVKDAAEDL